eukprot:488952_1
MKIMKSTIINLIVVIVIIAHVTVSKFVGFSSDFINKREINLKDNQRVGDVFETAQFALRYKTQQMYKGIPIYGATIVVEEDQYDMHITPISGKWYDKSDIEQLVPIIDPQITKDEAFDISVTALDINENELTLNMYSNIHSDLYIYHVKHVPYLSWITKFSYVKSYRIYRAMVIIDALNGNIIQTFNDEYNAIEACGNGGNGKTGEYKYCSDKPGLLINDNTLPVLENDLIQVYDGSSLYRSNNSFLITCSDLTYSVNDTYPRCYIDDPQITGGYCAACDAYYFANVAFQMFNEWTNATYPILPELIPLEIYVHTWFYEGRAGYDYDGKIYFGDGNLDMYPLTVLDVTAHEIAHGYTDLGSDLIYYDESGGMNEAFADISGEAAKFWLLGENDWKPGLD